MASKKNEIKIIAQHRKASFEYEIIDTYEAGMVLTGTEIKSLRRGNAVIRDGHISIREDEAWVHNLNIPEYSHGNRENHMPTRKRKLLLHHREIDRIRRKISQQGFSAFPIKLYFKGHRVKLEIGIGRGKKLYDKRQSEKEKSARRELRERY
jgi:SsrA-binding protein